MAERTFMDRAPADPLMALAWRDCLLWAVSEPEALAAFQRDTGVTYHAPRSALDRMIDDATGHGEEVAFRFVEWFNANVWGPTDEPAAAPRGKETTE